MSSPCSACLPQASGPAASAAHPDRWAGVSSLSLGVFALVTAEFLPASLLTMMATDLGVTDGAAGQAVTATALVAAVAAPVIPLATQRLDRKRVLLALTSLLLASNVRWSSVAGGALIAVLALALLAIASGAVGGGLLVDRVGPLGATAFMPAAMVLGTVLTWRSGPRRASAILEGGKSHA